MATSVSLGLAVLGDLACRSADKIEKTEPTTVQPVTDVEPPAGVEPIRLEEVEPSEVGTRQIVIEDDVRKLCEVEEMSRLVRKLRRFPKGEYRLDDNGQWKPVLINGVGKPPLENIIDIRTFNDNWLWSRFNKSGARFSPDFIHDRFWEDERKSVFLAPPQGE